MKLFRYAFWALIGICLIIVGMANRDIVTVRAMPEALGGLLGISPDIQLPLFVVIFMGVGAGLLIGFVWEWLREHNIRAQAREKAREVTLLKREMGRMRTEKHAGKDDVLALLDESQAAR